MRNTAVTAVPFSVLAVTGLMCLCTVCLSTDLPTGCKGYARSFASNSWKFDAAESSGTFPLDVQPRCTIQSGTPSGPFAMRCLPLRGGDGGSLHASAGKDMKGLSDPRVPTSVKDFFHQPPPSDIMKFEDGKCGVGLTLSQRSPYTILYIAEDSPAAKSDSLMEGDEIVAMDGQNLDGKSWTEVRRLALGAEGSILTLQVKPGNEAGDGSAEVECKQKKSKRKERAAAGSRKLHPSSSTVTVELQRVASPLPWWAAWAKDDAQAAQADGGARKSEMQEVDDELVGMDLHDFGRWRKLQDEETGSIFYHDSFNNRSQWDPPSAVKTVKKWQSASPDVAVKQLGSMEEEVESLRAWRQLEKDFEGDPSVVHPDVFERPDLASKVVQLYEELEAECLSVGVNLSAIPEEILPPAPELHGDVNGTEESEESRAARLSKVDDEMMARIFPGTGVVPFDARENGHGRTAEQEAEEALGALAAPAELLEELGELKQRVELEDEEGKEKEELLAALAVTQECWQDPEKFGFDLRKTLDSSMMSSAELQSLVKDVRGELPPGLPKGYCGLRLAAATRRKLAQEAGYKFSSPLLYGVDPLYNRVDFRIENVAGGQQRVSYVGDGAPGGWRRKDGYEV